MEELGFDSTTDGIAVLDELNVETPCIGDPIGETLGLNDTILDLAITANRPDGMSMVGIAREVAALTDSKIKLPELGENDTSGLVVGILVEVGDRIEVEDS